MATTQLIFAGPEQAIFGVAMTQLGKHYGLPVYINVGLTNSKRPDAQAGLECGVTLALGVAAGADIFGHMGIAGVVDQASSLDMLVLQDEVIAYVESTCRSIEFTDDTFALDTIAEVGLQGTFIDTEHTAAHYRRELWFPRLLDRRFYDSWRNTGATSTEDRCRARNPTHARPLVAQSLRGRPLQVLKPQLHPWRLAHRPGQSGSRHGSLVGDDL